jgi:predicted O-linked N-acetylglucosamine transferase (SPINDLY family)
MATFEQNKQQALHFHQTGNIVRARELYLMCLSINPSDIDLLNMLAALEASQDNTEEALKLLKRAIEIEPEYGYLYYSRGIILLQKGEIENAQKDIESALIRDPKLKPAQRIFCHMLQQQEKYDTAISVIIDYQNKYGNEVELDVELGYCYQKLGKLNFAIKHYQSATESLQNADVFFNLAVCQTLTFDWLSAEKNISKALSIEQQNLKFKSWDLYIRKLNCNWVNYQEDLNKLVQLIDQSNGENINSLPPGYILNVLGVSDQIHAKAIKWMHQIEKQPVKTLTYKRANKNSKIKLGYLSPDFRNHAVGMLLSPIIQHHDRNKFEIYGYSLRETNDPLNVKFRKEIDNYLDVSNFSSSEIAERINHDQIDILIDLAGLTDGSRPEILNYHPAPIQIGLWGYLNSIGGDCWDYILTDKEIWPELASIHYTEKPLFLDRSVLSSGIKFNKNEMPDSHPFFPKDATVIGSFNNSYKITEEWFIGWLKIIKNNENCWLWIYVPEQHIKKNLIRMAEQHIDDTSRIVYAEKVEYFEHLNRMRRVDIFADSFGYNAGASATAAILSGVPILTLKGDSMLARMGASINHDLGMNELICETSHQYWEKAKQLISNPKKLKELKQKLEKNKTKTKFGDPKKFCFALEKALLNLKLKE